MICVLETGSDVLTLAGKSLGLENKCIRITFYIDNNAANFGLIKVGSKTPIMDIVSRIFRAIVARRNITLWLERAGSDNDISDLPARVVELPYHIVPDRCFRSEQAPLDIPKREFYENWWGVIYPTGRILSYF